MDVVVWLRSLGLGKYEAAFRENDIDETVLPNLTAEDLKELGVPSLGHRQRPPQSKRARIKERCRDGVAVANTTASSAAPAGSSTRTRLSTQKLRKNPSQTWLPNST